MEYPQEINPVRHDSMPHRRTLSFFVSSKQRSSPYINHFIQPDTIIPDPTSPQAWNRYSYVGNRPIRFNDPTGHIACDGTGLGGVCDQSGIPSTLAEVKIELKSYGVSLKGDWVFDEAYEAYLAVLAVGEAFERITHTSGKDTFLKAFGLLNFYYGSAPGLDLEGNYGRTSCGSSICNLALKPGKITDRLIVHELGHAFDRRMWHNDGEVYGEKHPLTLLGKGIYDVNGKLITETLNRYNGLSSPENGYYCNCLESQYHSTSVGSWNDPQEDFADIFLNWTYNSFYPNSAGKTLFNWANINMSSWLQ